MKFLIIFLILIFLDATSDALMDKGRKWAGGIVDILCIGTWLVLLILATKGILTASKELSILGLILSYILLRYALFDLIYNNWRGLWAWYFGSTKITDRILVWIIYNSWFGRKFKPGQEHFLFITKIISLCLAIGILIFN